MEFVLPSASNQELHIVVAAGNINVDSCTHGPPGVLLNNPGSSVISVGATDIHGNRAYFSNWGEACTVLYSPGFQITSTYLGKTQWDYNNKRALSGTSAAAPREFSIFYYLPLTTFLRFYRCCWTCRLYAQLTPALEVASG